MEDDQGHVGHARAPAQAVGGVPGVPSRAPPGRGCSGGFVGARLPGELAVNQHLLTAAIKWQLFLDYWAPRSPETLTPQGLQRLRVWR